MEENEDEPEDVRLATPVEDEIKKADAAEEPAKGNVIFSKKRVKDDAKKRRAKEDGEKRKEEDDDEDCCTSKKRMKKERGAKWGTIHIFDKECKLPKSNTIPRHCLSKKEHLDTLATPSRKCEPQCLKKPVIRKLKPISPRIAELARPPMQRILRTIEDRGDTIAPELLDNLINMVEAAASMNPEQAAQLFHDKKSRSFKKSKRKKGKIKCRSKIEKERRKENGDYPLFDPEAVCCQYLMAERFVKSMLDWKCPIPKEEYQDIAEVILRRLSFIIEYTPIDNGDRKSQQMRFLADVISCWISGVLLEVAEAHKKELEEECERRKQAEEEETEEEEDESEEEIESNLSPKSDEESEDEEDKEEDKVLDGKSGQKDEDEKDKGDQGKKPEKESAAQTEEEDVIEEGEAGGEVMSDNGKADEEEAERRRVEEEAERRRLEDAEAEKKRAEEDEAERKRAQEEKEAERKRAEEEEAERQRVEQEEAEKKILEEAEIERKRAEEEEAARKQLEEEIEVKRLEEEEAEKKRLEEAEIARIRAEEEEAERKKLEEEEAARKKLEEEEAERKKLEEGEQMEEAEEIRVEEVAERIQAEEAAEEKKKEEAQDKHISKAKEFITIETGPPIKVFQSDLPFVTFIKICNALYSMIEGEKENTEEDPVISRLHRAVYEKFHNAVLTENPTLLTDNAKDVIDVMAGKIATWLSKVLTESQVLLLEKYPPEVESKEVRDWSNWIDHTTETAGNWSLWLQKCIEEVQKMQDNKVTRGQWEDFTQNLNKNAFLWRRFHLDTVHKAHHNVMMLKNREVVKTGEKKTPEYPEKELNVYNLE